ncbi:MAG TPA: hypothetical protein VLM37_06955 [Fibrobacteraceae bacterium]|nr:hypothetical protein [Fibrobacteraceae bacterium]
MQTAVSNAYHSVVGFLRAARADSKSRSRLWQELSKDLDDLGLDSVSRKAMGLWALENLDRHHPEHVRMRVLHEIEARYISSDAMGRLLEAQYLGMLSPAQVEQVLDDLGSREMTLVGADHMQHLIEHIWSRNLAGVRHLRVN